MSSSDSQDVPNSSGSFTFGTRLGLVFVVETASLSAVLVAGLLTYFLVRIHRAIRGILLNDDPDPNHQISSTTQKVAMALSYPYLLHLPTLL